MLDPNSVEVIDVATGKPYTGDWDLVGIKDTKSKLFIGPGARYDHVKNRHIREVGGQHGAEVNIVTDMTEHVRPGTPEYDAAVNKALAQRGKLQAKHTGMEEVVVQIGPDGVLRRGPVGTEIDLAPTQFAPDVAPQVQVPTQPAGAGDAGGAIGGATSGEAFRDTDIGGRT